MDSLFIKGISGEYDVPTIRFDAITGSLEISGKSFLEDTLGFYIPILDWLEKFSHQAISIVFDVKLEYFNTSSAKVIFEMIAILSRFEHEGGSLIINWYVDEDDADIEEEIMEIEENLGVHINLMKVNNLDKFLNS